MKSIFSDAIGCPIEFYNFQLIKSESVLEALVGFVQSKNETRKF